MRKRRGGGELLIVAIGIIAFGIFLLSPIATLIGFISLVIGGVLAAFAIFNMFSGGGRRSSYD